MLKLGAQILARSSLTIRTLKEGKSALLKKSRDPNNVGFDAVYDLLGRATSQTDTVAAVTSTSYDKAGNVKTQTDAKNKVTTTIYDVLGRTKGVTDRLTNQTSYAYDLAGRMTSITDAQACFFWGKTTSYAYNATGPQTACQDRRNLPRSHGRELG
jgi:YD repeat-containing protein